MKLTPETRTSYMAQLPMPPKLIIYVACVVVGFHQPTPVRGQSATPKVVRPRHFNSNEFQNPEPIFWPAYFWLWNGPLSANVLKSQLRDMAQHDAKSVCVLPMPKEFRPDSTANRMDVDYLSPEYFERVKAAVDEAERLGMNYWIYDEGGWPSGQAAGRVVATRPDLCGKVMRVDAQSQWTLQSVLGRPDILNPAATETFITLTHARYREAVGNHFGNTIQMVFTDEPAFPAVRDGREIPWTNEGATEFARRFGYEFAARLPTAFAAKSPSNLSNIDAQTRIDAFDFFSQRFRDAYFDRLRTWCRNNGNLAHGGHLGGEDETLGAVKYGYGHVMRQLRALDVPGVDVIWRQVFPGQRNHHFPKFASSAAHQNGTALALTESFCVYGNGLTPAQMKWLVDYQYVRGLNLLVAGCCPLTTEEHHMLGERPHFGPVNPLWECLPKFHRYVARLGYLLACGEPAIDTALYYPVRDLWATGADSPAAATHDALAQQLFERQCDFDIIDDDLLADPRTTVSDGLLHAGAMKYRTVVVGATEHMLPQSRERLAVLERSGGTVVRINDLKDAATATAKLRPTVELMPRAADIRCNVRRWPSGGVLMLFNEGTIPYTGHVAIQLEGIPAEVDLADGTLTSVTDADRRSAICRIPIALGGGESRIFLFGRPTKMLARRSPIKRLDLNDDWEARAIQQHSIGQHDYEIRTLTDKAFQPITLGSWNALVGPDFSGVVAYRRHVQLPADWKGSEFRLHIEKIDYAARIRVNDQHVGDIVYPPLHLDFHLPETQREFILTVEVANTLANELTSERVQKAIAERHGPGWPGPYHQRALVFERESRSGGLFGPVSIELLEELVK